MGHACWHRSIPGSGFHWLNLYPGLPQTEVKQKNKLLAGRQFSTSSVKTHYSVVLMKTGRCTFPELHNLSVVTQNFNPVINPCTVTWKVTGQVAYHYMWKIVFSNLPLVYILEQTGWCVCSCKNSFVRRNSGCWKKKSRLKSIFCIHTVVQAANFN